MSNITADETRTLVRDHYGAIAKAGAGPLASGCCGAPGPDYTRTLGYSPDDEGAAPDGANLGLGCGNPTALAALKPGEVVLDLGAGGGFDCFLAARQVGATGRVIGVDMTADMVTLARANAAKLGVSNVEFRLGEIEHLPIGDAAIDTILSNCVVNLSPDKAAVFREAYRVLTPGGRLAISDIVTIAEIPAGLRAQAAALTGCMTGAASIEQVRAHLAAAGFVDVTVTIAPNSAAVVSSWMAGAENFVASAVVTASKPRTAPSTCCPPSCCA